MKSLLNPTVRLLWDKRSAEIMQKMKLKEKPIVVVCNNCFKQTIGIRDETGLIKFQCSKCGCVTVSKVIGRRHVQTDIYAPKGQELIDDYD